MKIKKLLALIGSVCLLLVLAVLPFMAACAPEEAPPAPEEVEWKIFIPCPPGMPMPFIYQWMNEQFEERYDGRLTLDIYTGGMLPYKEADLLTVISDGLVEMVDAANVHIEGQIDWIGVTALPTIYPTSATAEKLGDEIVKPFMDRELREHWNSFLLFQYTLAPSADILYCTEKITSLDDIKGWHIRAAPPSEHVILSELGAIPERIDFMEVCVALERGTIDGAITSIESAGPAGWLGPCKWIHPWNICYVFEACIVNLDAFNALPKDLQEALLIVGAEAEEYATQLCLDLADEWWQKAEEAGVTVVPLSASDRQRLTEAAAIVEEQWITDPARSDKAKELYNLIKEAQQ